jgi:hypothetical protein
MWWALQDSNLGPAGYEPAALTAELRAQLIITRYHFPLKNANSGIFYDDRRLKA